MHDYSMEPREPTVKEMREYRSNLRALLDSDSPEDVKDDKARRMLFGVGAHRLLRDDEPVDVDDIGWEACLRFQDEINDRLFPKAPPGGS